VAAVKWSFVVLFGLGGLSALGMGLVSGGVSRTPQLASAPPLSLRSFAGGPAPAPVAEKVADGAKTPVPVAAKTPEKAPEPAKAPVAAAPVAAKPPPVAAAPAAPAPPAEGLLNLRATDTADVYLDGKKLGGSPMLGVKAKAGNHKVRFDCYDAAGNALTGAAQTVSVKPEAETDIEFPCPVE
jgi:hypothetical protein